MPMQLPNKINNQGDWLFELGSEFTESYVDGLIPVRTYNPLGRPPEEVSVMGRAASYGAHSVFFEAERNGRPSIAQAFIFIDDAAADDDHFAELHKRLWSWGGVPLLYRKTRGLVQLFRCAHKPDFVAPDGRLICHPVRQLELAAKVSVRDGATECRPSASSRKWCMTARMRSRLIPASRALPFHNRQRRRSTSSTITAFAVERSGLSADKPPATRVRCCSRMARWNQSRIGRPSMPASWRMRRSPGQPPVNAVSTVSLVRPTASRLPRISATRSVSVFATAPNTCRRPVAVSTLPIRTSRCRSSSSQLRTKVESKVTTIASAGVAGRTVAGTGRFSATLKVWRRKLPGA